jgi:hypothetical protein
LTWQKGEHDCASAEFAAASFKVCFDRVMITSDRTSMIAGIKKEIISFQEDPSKSRPNCLVINLSY